MELRRYRGFTRPDKATPNKVLTFPLNVVGIVKFTCNNRVYGSLNMVRFVRDYSTNRAKHVPTGGAPIDDSNVSARTKYEGLMLHYGTGLIAEENYLSLKRRLVNDMICIGPVRSIFI
jgi:hypothetical protein